MLIRKEELAFLKANLAAVKSGVPITPNYTFRKPNGISPQEERLVDLLTELQDGYKNTEEGTFLQLYKEQINELESVVDSLLGGGHG